MKTKLSRYLTALILIAILSLLSTSQSLAQEGVDGFTEEFDEVNWEEWERSQDLTVEDGVLRMGGGNFLIRLGDWSEIDLTLQLRFQTPNEIVINYYLRDEGHYALILLENHLILQKISEGQPSPLEEAPVEYLGDQSWNKVNIKVTGGNHTISLNDTQVLTAADPEPLSTGAVMLQVFGETGVEVDSISLTGTMGAGPIPEGERPPEEGPPPDEPSPQEPHAEEQPSAAPLTDADTSEKLSLIEELMSGQSNQLELTTFLINLILAVICAFILGRVYIYWGSSLSNRRAFAANFMLLTVTTTFIILVVRSSVALSLGLVGALSIVRFRAAVKEPEELAYLFFAISLGIGLGDNQRLITLLTLVVAIAIIGLLKVFRNSKADVNLHLTISSQSPEKVDINRVNPILEKHCSKIKLLRFDETADVLESTYLIEFKRLSDLNQARADLHSLSPSMQISFLDNKGIW
ncbi:MAG: DUF4956 domain-containing protein [Anaerolineales bacterium]|nr:DUF4956 domain-containing protein [Anaerolineales bacterium]